MLNLGWGEPGAGGRPCGAVCFSAQVGGLLQAPLRNLKGRPSQRVSGRDVSPPGRTEPTHRRDGGREAGRAVEQGRRRTGPFRNRTSGCGSSPADVAGSGDGPRAAASLLHFASFCAFFSASTRSTLSLLLCFSCTVRQMAYS